MVKPFLLIFFMLKCAYGAESPKSKPRTDLYQKIQKITDVSLRGAFQAVYRNNGKERYKLQRFAKVKGTQGIIKEFQKEIKEASSRCKKSKTYPFLCHEQIEGVRAKLATFQNLDKQIKKNPKLELYKSLAVFNYVIRHEVLEAYFQNWQRRCASQKMVNTKFCEDMLFEGEVLYRISLNLSKAAFAKALKKTIPDNRKGMDSLIGRYE